MNLPIIIKAIIALTLPTLVAQGYFGGNAPPMTPEEQIASATMPPAAYTYFTSDFCSFDTSRVMTWIHPSRGLVRNGILLTKEEAQKAFSDEFQLKNDSRFKTMNVTFNFGSFVGANMYQADTWIEYTLKVNNQENTFPMHNVFVFEIIDNGWYLVQSEFIPPDANITLMREGGILNHADQVPEDLQKFIVPTTEAGMYTTGPWPLLLGSNYASESELSPLKGKMPSGREWTLAHAVKSKKPTVMYFFSVRVMAVSLGDEFEKEMDFLASLYQTFNSKDVYIFGVTDSPLEQVESMGKAGFNKFAPLLDEGSKLHSVLNIDTHPYVVVFDAEGTVVCIAKTYHPSNNNLIKERIRSAIAKAGK